LRRTPEAVGAEIRKLTETAKYMTLWYAVEIGRRLTEAKELVKHGEWMDFLAKETEFSSSSASRFMTAFREYGGGEKLNFPTLGNISVSNALRLLAVPEEERESFAAEVDAAHISTRELEAAIRERDEAKKALAEAEQTMKEFSEQNVELTDGIALAEAQMEASEKLRAELADELAGTRSEIAAAKRRIAELESRPIDVAVQEPDPTEIERRAAEIAKEAGAAAEKQIQQLREEKAASEAQVRAAEEKAKAERDRLREKLKAAEDRLSSAGAEDKAAADKLRGEVEALKKQLAMSDAALVTFKLRFQQWQEAFKAAMAALVRLPEGTKEKCKGAILAQLENWKEAV